MLSALFMGVRMRQFARVPQLRVAVNASCGRHCFYCRPSGEAVKTSPGSSADLDLVTSVARLFAAYGGREVKLTGGEPALWRPLVSCVRRLKREIGLPDVAIISRHPRIATLAPALAEAGVDLLNMSLDTLRPDRHKSITGVDDLADMIAALRKCVATGVPCRVNMVVIGGVNVDEVQTMVCFCEDEGVASLKLLDVIKDLDSGSEHNCALHGPNRRARLADAYAPLTPVFNTLRARAVRVRVLHQSGLGHPMAALRMPSGLEVILKDHQAGAWHGTVCNGCPFYPCHDALMALRLTSDARLQFCLLREDNTLDLKPVLRSGDDGIAALIAQALWVYDTARFRPGRGTSWHVA